MPEKKEPRRRFHFNMAAASAIEEHAKRIGKTSKILARLAENLASGDEPLPDGLSDVVQIEHVERASQALRQAVADAESLSVASAGVFLSYSTKDEDFARELEADLRAEGVSCFLAPLSIKPGASWPDEIWQAIRACRVLVLLVTADAMKSKWCLLEIGAAFGLKKSIIAVLRHSNKLPEVLKTVQAVKVQTKKQQADLVKLLKQLFAS